MPPELTLRTAVEALAGALLVGLLIGAQREASGGDRHPGLRDFTLVSLTGGICGVLNLEWLDAAAMLSIAILFGVFHYEDRENRGGITTELAAGAVFLLSLLAASWKLPFALPLAIGAAIIAAAFLEARDRLHKLVRETITEPEFNATLAFIALVAVIYPLLPSGSFGPYSFFAPRQVWLFVILISSISYLGYFLKKFLGEERGRFYTSLLGGLASTTAATIQFAKLEKDSHETVAMLRSFVIANSVQFPRTLLIVAAVSMNMAILLVAPMTAMLLAGVIGAEILHRWPHPPPAASSAIAAENPFRLLPALRFGVLFTAIVFVSKAASAQLGVGAFYVTSLLGGLVDVATVIAPAADLVNAHRMELTTAAIAVMLGLVANAVLKVVLAAISGRMKFALLVLACFAVWTAVGALAWWAALPWAMSFTH